jgi:radical SAM superfamily enzyme YgiQ (UPF0313 family)
VRVSFGAESGDAAILAGLGKKTDRDLIRRAFRLCREVGLEAGAFFILGLPGDTRATMAETIAFALELDPDTVTFNIANPLPGTRFRELVERGGRLLRPTEELSGHFDSAPNFELGEVTPDLLLRMRREAYLRFYLRPRWLARQVLSGRLWRALPSYVEGLRRLWRYSKV